MHFAFCILSLLLAPPLRAAEFRHIYVPIEDLDVLFRREKGVLVSKEEFAELWKRAYPQGMPVSDPARDLPDAMLTGGQYTGRIAGDVIEMTGALVFETPRAGWQAIPIDLAGLGIGSARLGDGPAKLGRDPQGRLVLLLDEPGRHRLSLDLFVPLAPASRSDGKAPPAPAPAERSGGSNGSAGSAGSDGSDGSDRSAGRVARFRLPPAAGALALDVPADHELFVGGRRMTRDEQGRYRIPVGGLGDISLGVIPIAAEGVRHAVLVAQSEATIHLTPSELDWRGALEIEVSAEPVGRITITLPASLQVVEAKALGLAGWDVAEEALRSQLVLRFERPWTGRRSVTLRAIGAPVLGEPWALPRLEVAGAASQAGVLHIQHDASLALELERVRFARRLAPQSAQEPALHLAWWRPDYEARVLVRPKVPKLAASVVTLLAVARHRVELVSSLTLEPRHAPLFEVPLRLPREWSVTRIEAAGQPLPFQPREDGPGWLVRLALPAPVRAGDSIDLVVRADHAPEGWLAGPNRATAIGLATVDVEGASEVEGMLLVRAPEEIRVQVAELRELESVPVSGVPGSDDEVRLALRYRAGEPARRLGARLAGPAVRPEAALAGPAGRLEATLAEPRITVETHAGVRMAQSFLRTRHQVRYEIRAGVTAELQFELAGLEPNQVEVFGADGVPEKGSDPLASNPEQMTSSQDGRGQTPFRITSQSVSEAENGRRRWLLRFDRDLRGSVVVGVRTEQPIEAGRPVAVPAIEVPGAVRQTGTIAVEGELDQELTTQAKDLAVIDPSEIGWSATPGGPESSVLGTQHSVPGTQYPVLSTRYSVGSEPTPPTSRLVAAYRYHAVPYSLSLAAAKHEPIDVLTVVCRQAAILSVVDATGRARHHARYALDNLGLASLPVELPAGSAILSAALDGAPAEVRRQEGTVLLSLPVGAGGTVQTTLDLVYENEVAPGVLGRTFRQAPPRLRLAGQYDVPVLQLVWRVHLPDEVVVVRSDGPIRPKEPLSRPSIIGALRNALAARRTGRIFNPLELLAARQVAREAARRSAVPNNVQQRGGAAESGMELELPFMEEKGVAETYNYLQRDREISLDATIGLEGVGEREADRAKLDEVMGELRRSGKESSAIRGHSMLRDMYGAAQREATGKVLVTIPLEDVEAVGGPVREGSTVDIFDADVPEGTQALARPLTTGATGRVVAVERAQDGRQGNVTLEVSPEDFRKFTAAFRFRQPINGGKGEPEAGEKDQDQFMRRQVAGEHTAPGSKLRPGSVGGVGMGGMAESSDEPAMGGFAGRRELRVDRFGGGDPGFAEQGAPDGRLKRLSELNRGELTKGIWGPVSVDDPRVALAWTKRRGLLSLVLNLQPVGRGYTFEALGAGGELDLRLQNDDFARTFTWLVVAGLVTLGWLGRNRSRWLRALAIGLALAAAIGLSGLVPLAAVFLLDGLFLGAIGAWGLYLARPIARWLGSVLGLATRPLARATPLALLLAVSQASAAEPGAPADPVPGAAAAPEHKVPGLFPEKAEQLPTIYIPYDPARDPLASNQVYLPQEDYRRLWNLANPERVIPADAPIEGLASQAHYSGKLAGSLAQFEARVTLWSLRDDWVAIPVPLRGAVFTKVLLDGQPATLAAPGAMPQAVIRSVSPVSEPKPPNAGSGPPTLPSSALRLPSSVPSSAFPVVFLRGRGEHRLELSFEVPVRRSGATGDLTLQLGPVGSARLELELPEPGLEVRASVARSAERGVRSGELAGGLRVEGQRLVAAVDEGGAVTITWQPPSARSAAQLLASVEQKARVEIEPAGVRYLAQLDYSVHQGTAQELRVRIPEPGLIRQVAGEWVGGWSMEGEGAERTLVVLASQPLSGSFSLGLDLFLPLPRIDQAAQEVSLPTVTPLGISRQKGELAILADPSIEVRVQRDSGYQQIDRASFTGPLASPETGTGPKKGTGPISRNGPEGAAQKLDQSPFSGRAWPMLAAYRYAGQPAPILLRVLGRPASLRSHALVAILVQPERIRLSASVELVQTGMPLVSARLRLPEGFSIDAVRTAADVRWFEIGAGAAPVIEIERTASANGDRTQIALEGWISRDPDELAVRIPAIEVEGAERQEGQWAVFLAPGLDAETAALVGGLRPLEPAGLDTRLGTPPQSTALEPVSVTGPPRLAFRQDRFPAELSLRLKRLAPRVRATIVTVVSLRETALAYVSQIRYTIEQAGVRQLGFVAPAWLGQDLDISGPGVRQVESAEGAEGADGSRTFRVGLDREVMGEYALVARQVFPLPEDGIVRAPRLAATGVESAHQYVLLENQSPDQLDRLADEALRTEPLEPREVPAPLAEPLRAGAIETVRILSETGQLAWRLRTSEKLDSLAASVNLADLVLVVDAQARYRAQMNYRVHNRSEQFLALAFPPNSRIWSVYVGGFPSRPAREVRGGKELVLVPLSKNAAGDFSSNVEIVYAGELPVSEGWVRRWDFPAPDVVDLPLAQTQVTLYLPDELDYGMFQGNLEEAEAGYLELNRQAAELQEAFGIVPLAFFGKGQAKYRSASNLTQLDLSLRNPSGVATEKGQQLLQKVQSQATQLGQEIDRLGRQGITPPAAASQVDLDQYFTPPPSPVSSPAAPPPAPSAPGQAGEKKESGRKAADDKEADKAEAAKPQDVRQRLQDRLEKQTYELNVQNAAPSEEAARNARRLVNEGMDVTEAMDRAPSRSMERRFAGPPVGAAPPGPPDATNGRSKLPYMNRLYKSQARDEVFVDLGAPVRGGGLSLRIELPAQGQKFHFVKSRGNPTLSVPIYRADLAQWGTGFLWLLASAAVVLAASWWLGRSDSWRIIAGYWRWCLVAAGLVWWLALPASALGFLLLLLGAFLVVLSALVRRRTALTHSRPA